MLPVVQATNVTAVTQGGPTPEALAEELMAVFTHIQRVSTSGLYELVESLDLSLTQIKALHALDAGPAPSVKELADQLGLSLPAASRAVESLLRKGLVTRTEDEHDRRIKRIALTSEGQEAAIALHRERLAGLRDFAASLTDPQRTRLHRALAGVLNREEIAACRP